MSEVQPPETALQGEYRGSRKHVLTWVEKPSFRQEVVDLLRPLQIEVGDHDRWMPVGFSDTREARLERDGLGVLSHEMQRALQDYWLVHARGANTPNWDLALTCSIDGKRGLVLVEAKAHKDELSDAGKPQAADATDNSKANHEQIERAVAQANAALNAHAIGFALSIDRNYQFTNRVAFSWWLASHGIPVILVYLGFTGDAGVRGSEKAFVDGADWGQLFASHITSSFPIERLEQPIDCGEASFTVAVRSLPA